MDAKHRFTNVHWIWGGGISFVYEVHPRIVVKVPKSGEFERKQFAKELEIYRIFSQNSSCSSIIQCYLISDRGIFLEYMRDMSLSSRIQRNHTRNQETMIVTSVETLKPLYLRTTWMKDLALAVAFLESLGLAHGDLRPENILLDRDRLKIPDFDCTAKIGTVYEACMAPYGRLLDAQESDQGLGEGGTSGFLGPRTETFALGSLYYLINYSFEVYGDRCLAEDPHEHGPMDVEKLQSMEFPALNGDPLIDDIVHKCWHNEYTTVSQLAIQAQLLLSEKIKVTDADGERKSERGDAASVAQPGFTELINTKQNDERHGKVEHVTLDGELISEKEICEDLNEQGLLQLLSSGEPEQIGFTLGWYRHSLPNR